MSPAVSLPSAGPDPAQTPARLGYRMPAEWAPHVGTWLTWPRSDGISFPDRYNVVPGVYAALIRELVNVEGVNINVWDKEMEEWVRGILSQWNTPLARVHFHHFPAYEPWCRDHGPIFLVRTHQGRRERAVVDWGYNAWGNKYPPYDKDDDIPKHVAALRKCPLFSPGMVLEGGSIDVDGEGSLLTTEACLLNPNRNPGLSRAEIEQRLREYLGVTNILWLGEGIVGDDTDGHIDDIARFLGPGKIAAVLEDDPADENYGLLQDNWKRLIGFRDHLGQPYRLIKLPTPGVVEHKGQRLPASYANFYIANRLVIVPIFHHRNDQLALDTLQREFHSRRVIGIDSSDLIWGLGSFHCITQQEPG